MYTCEIQKDDSKYLFECLDASGSSLLRSLPFESRVEALKNLNDYLKTPSQKYVYEVCEGRDCHYFKIALNGIVLLESRTFDNKDSVYDYVEKLKKGCKISHIIDRSFESGEVFYYLSCTSKLQFKSPIKIYLEKEDDQYVASIPELRIFAYADDISKVIFEIKSDLDDLYDDLFLMNHKLSNRAKKLKLEFESKLHLDGVS